MVPSSVSMTLWCVCWESLLAGMNRVSVYCVGRGIETQIEVGTRCFVWYGRPVTTWMKR